MARQQKFTEQKVIANKIPPNTVIPKEDDKIHAQKLASHERRKGLVSMAEQIANDNFFYVNYKWTHEDQTRPWFNTVGRFFPYAEGGPLYIDEPRFTEEIKRCEEKAVVMKSVGLRYVYIIPKQSKEEILSQLEGVE